MAKKPPKILPPETPAAETDSRDLRPQTPPAFRPGIVIVGYTTTLKPQAAALSGGLTPANAKKFEEEAPYLKWAASLASIYAVKPHKFEIFSTEDCPQLPPAVAFFRWLAAAYGELLSPELWHLEGRDPPPFRLIGFDASSLPKLVGAECLLHKEPMPVRFWYGNSHCYDPLEVATAGWPEALRRQLSLRYLLEQLAPDLLDFADKPQHVSAKFDALLAFELAVELQLFPLPNVLPRVQDTVRLELRKLPEAAKPEEAVAPEVVELLTAGVAGPDLSLPDQGVEGTTAPAQEGEAT